MANDKTPFAGLNILNSGSYYNWPDRNADNTAIDEHLKALADKDEMIEEDLKALADKDETPPPPVVGFKATVNGDNIDLAWRNPDDTDFVGVKIIKNESGYPTSVNDGVLVCDGVLEAFTDVGVTKGKYIYYRAFTYDFDDNYQTDGSQIAREIAFDDPFMAPGPKNFVAGDMAQGYFGETSTTELISGTALASMIGLTAGTVQYDASPWIKSAIDGKVIYWAKRTFRHSVSWDQINAAGAVYGDKIITIGDHQYRVRLFRGSVTNPSDFSGAAVHGSEFNRVVLPTHEQAKSGSWVYPENVGPDDAPNTWGINYTDADLVFHNTAGDGSLSWMQEAGTESPTNRFVRGSLGVSYATDAASSYTTPIYGWRPVLEVVS